MKGTPASLWMSAAHRAMGWWRGSLLAETGRQKARLVRAALPKLPKVARRGKTPSSGGDGARR